MSSDLLRNLIKYIITRVQDEGGYVLRTRLVKLIYLSDVEHFRSTRRRLTDLKWFRYMYGPYAFELPQIARSIGFDLQEEATDFSTGRGVRYSVFGAEHLERFFALPVQAIIDRVIDRWGTEDLDSLLDYVYCYTEPMRDTKLREPLDFNRIVTGLRHEVHPSLDIPQDAIEAIRETASQSPILSRPASSVDVGPGVADALTSLEDAPPLHELAGKARPPRETSE